MSASSESWLLLESGPCLPTYNMALDEALLLAATGLGRPILRFYGWQKPAATFGYFQKIAQIESATLLRPLLRRPTGGGLVPHASDWTYSLTFPSSHHWYHLRAPVSYERLHQWLQAAFQSLGVATELAPCGRKEIPGQCFAGWEKSDLLQSGRKIAGAAQRRTKSGLLIQGSIQPYPAGVQREAWETALLRCATQAWDVTWRRAWDRLPVETSARQLVESKYDSDGYNRMR